MKLKHLILITAILIVPMSSSYAADFYPELGIDPFYSSLNPMHIDKDEVINQNDSIVDMIKNKKTKVEVEQVNVIDVEPMEDFIDSSSMSVDVQSVESNTIEAKSEKSPNFFQRLFSKKEKNNEVDPFYHDEEDIPSYLLDEDEEEDVLPEDDSFITKKKKSGQDLVKELEKEEREKQKALLPQEERKKFSLKEFLGFGKNVSKSEDKSKVKKEEQLEITADHMEYFPDRYEVEAIGNAKVDFKAQGVVLSATKIIFNYDRNILKANENVVLLSKGSITEGDFIRIDLNAPEGIFENPVTKTEDIILKAKEARVYSDRIEEYDGVAKILKDEKMRFGSTSFGGYVNQTVYASELNNEKQEEMPSGLYSLKAKTIYIDSKEEHDVITIKNADLFLKNKKVASVPSAKIVSNKTNTNVETNLPEFGSMSQLGAHIGPAVVLNVPGGNTLKLSPILTYSKDEFGLGAIARFRSANNMTEAAYGTSREEFLLRGKHKLAPGLTLNYSRLTSSSEWFLGYRRPKYSAALNYRRNDYVKDLDLHFSQMYIAGAVVDDSPNKHLEDVEGRFRWMTQTYKPIYTYKNEEGNIGFSTGLVAQTAATVYTTGDVSGIFRFGPAVNTKVGPWRQSLMYYQTAIAGSMPFDFDRYRYGRSNIVLIESLKVCKYLSLGYLSSIALNREVSSDKTFQENRILLSIGPDYAKVTIGFDAFRRNTMFLFSMLVGTKDTDVEFKRSVIKNPQTFGKENKKTKKIKKKNYKKYLDKDVPIETT